MRVLKILAGSLLWVLAGLLGILGAVLSVTIVLLPLGIPLLWLARKVFRAAMALMVPRKVRHPVSEAGKSVSDAGDSVRSRADSARSSIKSFAKHQRKRFA